eukprot:scpid88598/ scgid19831/ 
METVNQCTGSDQPGTTGLQEGLVMTETGESETDRDQTDAARLKPFTAMLQNVDQDIFRNSPDAHEPVLTQIVHPATILTQIPVELLPALKHIVQPATTLTQIPLELTEDPSVDPIAVVETVDQCIGSDQPEAIGLQEGLVMTETVDHYAGNDQPEGIGPQGGLFVTKEKGSVEKPIVVKDSANISPDVAGLQEDAVVMETVDQYTGSDQPGVTGMQEGLVMMETEETEIDNDQTDAESIGRNSPDAQTHIVDPATILTQIPEEMTEDSFIDPIAVVCDKRSLVEFLVRWRVLANEMPCPVCQREMVLFADSSNVDGFIWVCTREACAEALEGRYTWSVRSFSEISDVKGSLMDLVSAFLSLFDYKNAAHLVQVPTAGFLPLLPWITRRCCDYFLLQVTFYQPERPVVLHILEQSRPTQPNRVSFLLVESRSHRAIVGFRESVVQMLDFVDDYCEESVAIVLKGSCFEKSTLASADFTVIDIDDELLINKLKYRDDYESAVGSFYEEVHDLQVRVHSQLGVELQFVDACVLLCMHRKFMNRSALIKVNPFIGLICGLRIAQFQY